ncbi:hypothetical protein COB55_01195 [Candidatus Wolfebacteria bacterium]|nr:MAG: hypothetical protein COB55_01195 [Candidatus Wolfebacteria bacterium]
MNWLTAQRIIKSGFVNFWRSGFVSLASVLVMTTTLLVIAGLIFTNTFLNTTLNQIKEKVDINVYFLPDAPTPDIFALRSALETLPEVLTVEYVTRDQAELAFREKFKDDETKIQALDLLDDNPFGGRFNIRAQDPSQYEGIATFLESNSAIAQNDTVIIESVTYAETKIVIDRLSHIIDTIEILGLIVSAIFLVMSVLITFNTIRLAIYISREEISVMQLVGASNSYVRGPFVVSGIMYGFVAGILTLVILYPLTYWLGPKSARLFIDVNVFNYYVSNFGEIFLIIMVSGIALGSVSSYLAVRRYLKV